MVKFRLSCGSNILIIFLFTLLGCFSALAESSENNIVFTTEHKTKLVIGIPQLEGDNDEPIRHLRSYLKDFWLFWGENNGYQIDFKRVNLLTSSKALTSGEIDIQAVSFYQPQLANKQFVSIPYIDMSGTFYRQYGATSPAKKPVLHVPFFEMALDNPFTIDKTVNFCDLITDDSDFDLIYSWAPWIASEELKNLERGMRFHKIQKSAPALAIRAAVLKHNRNLILSINQSLRNFDSETAIQMWSKHVPSHIDYFESALGEYTSEIPLKLQQYIIEHPVSDFAYFDGGFAPYLIPDETHVSGYIPDLLTTISKRTGLTFQAKRFDTVSHAIDAVTNQQVDLLSNLYKTPQRQREMLFSQSFDNSMTVIVSNRHDQFVRFNQLKDKVVAVAEGTHVSKKLKLLFPNDQILLVNSMEEALLAVAEGGADAFIGNGLNASFKIHKLNLGHLSVNKPQEFENDQLYYFGINKSKPELQSLINLGLQTIGELELDQLHQKWVSSVLVQGAEQRYETLYRRVSTTGLIILLLAILIGSALHIHLTNLRRTKLEVVDALAQAEKSREHAESLAKAKTDFLARMSHEIRTPMNGVLGMAEALSYTKLNIEQKDLLDTLNGSAQNLMALLNDVLDFSKMDAGKLTVEQTPSNLNGLLTNVINNFRHKAKYAGLELNLRLDEQLSENYLTDPTRFMQLLNNLISNSIKFTPTGFIELSAQLLTVDPNNPKLHHIKVDVRDTGIGIDAEKISTLFDPFTQAEGDTTRRFGGTGLGLSICKEITEALGGEVKVTSMPGKGSLFSIVLKLMSTDEVGILQGCANVDIDQILQFSAFSDVKILLAEDNPVNRKVIGGQLGRLGLEVDQAENGLIAYQMYLQGDYDIVISDCHMPEMDGFTLANKISNEREGSVPRLIAITADALSGAEQSCLSAGFDNYIAKPCPIDILQQKLYAEIALLSDGRTSKLILESEQPLSQEKSDNSFIADNIFDLIVEHSETNSEVSDEVGDDVFQAFSAEVWDTEQHNSLNTINRQSGADDLTHFNASHLLELSGGDRDIAVDILAVYLDGAEDDLKQFETLVHTKSLQSLKDLAHRVKGSVRYLGAVDLGDISQCIELACESGDIKNIEALVDELVKGLHQVKCEVDVWLLKEEA